MFDVLAGAGTGGVGGRGYSSAFVLIYTNTPGTTSHIYIMDMATPRPPRQITYCSATLRAILIFLYTYVSVIILAAVLMGQHGLIRILPCSNSGVDTYSSRMCPRLLLQTTAARGCAATRN